MAEVNKLYLKIGTKAQYNSKKASLAEPAKTLALTPLAEEFSSNTTAGKGQFGVAGVTITTLTGTVGSGVKPVYLNSGTITASTSSVGNNSRPVYMNAGTVTQVNIPGSGAWFTGVPSVATDGVMEIGRYIDFHPTNASTADYGVRLDSGVTTNQRTFLFPTGTNGGVYILMTTSDFRDVAYTDNAYHSIYFASADNNAGEIGGNGIGMAAEATLSFNPSTKKFKYTTTDGTALNFGLQKVSSW